MSQQIPILGNIESLEGDGPMNLAEASLKHGCLLSGWLYGDCDETLKDFGHLFARPSRYRFGQVGPIHFF